MPKVMAIRSIANDALSGSLLRTKRSPSAIERRIDTGSASGSALGGCGASASRAATIARQLTASKA